MLDYWIWKVLFAHRMGTVEQPSAHSTFLNPIMAGHPQRREYSDKVFMSHELSLQRLTKEPEMLRGFWREPFLLEDGQKELTNRIRAWWAPGLETWFTSGCCKEIDSLFFRLNFPLLKYIRNY